MTSILEAIKATHPSLHGIFSKALAECEANDDLDSYDRIFAQAVEKSDSLFESIDDAYPDNEWTVIDIVDELTEWMTESP